jgi:hypothetical protein
VPWDDNSPALPAAAVGVWSLKTGEKICASTSTMWSEGIWLQHPADNSLVLFVGKMAIRAFKWLQHPADNSLVLFVGKMAIRAFKWDSLAEVDLASDGDAQESDPNHRQHDFSAIDGIARAITVGERHVVFQATWLSDVAYPIIMTGRRTFTVDLGQPTRPWNKGPIEDPLDLATHIIGSFQGHLVFLDQDYYFCTWDFSVGAASLKRHFHLPKDWLVSAMLDRCVVNEEGTVLCPRNGEVAVIRGGIKL